MVASWPQPCCALHAVLLPQWPLGRGGTRMCMHMPPIGLLVWREWAHGLQVVVHGPPTQVTCHVLGLRMHAQERWHMPYYTPLGPWLAPPTVAWGCGML